MKVIPTMTPEQEAQWAQKVRDNSLFVMAPPRREHGPYVYSAGGCRCHDCYEALKAKRAERVPFLAHGLTRYTRGCRCEVCKAASHEVTARRWAKQKDAATRG